MSKAEGILEELLECCICLELCQPPIHQCKNGHNICSFHIPEIGDLCPICRVRYEFGGSRNLLAENIISNILKNREIKVEKEEAKEEPTVQSDDQITGAGAQVLPRPPSRMGTSILTTQRTLTTNSTWPGAKPLKSLAVYSKPPPPSEFATPLKSLATYSPTSPTATTPTSPLTLFGPRSPFATPATVGTTQPIFHRPLKNFTSRPALPVIQPTPIQAMSSASPSTSPDSAQSSIPSSPAPLPVTSSVFPMVPSDSPVTPPAASVTNSPALLPTTPPAIPGPASSGSSAPTSPAPLPLLPSVPTQHRFQSSDSSPNDDKPEEDHINDNIAWVKVDGQWIEQRSNTTVSIETRPTTAATLVPDISLDTVRKKYETLSKVRGIGVLVTPWPPSSSTIRRASNVMGQVESGDENFE